MRSSVPTRRLGTPFQRPAWRYDALRNPDKYGFRSFCSRKVDNAGCLRRLIKKGLDHRVNFVVPAVIQQLSRNLPPRLSDKLFAVWKRRWRQTNQPKLAIERVDEYQNLVVWNARKMPRLPDPWLRKLVEHVSNIEFYPDIDAALKLHLNDDYAQIKRYIGHLIFAKQSDAEIAKEWNFSPSTITALRMLFFDFSALPTSPVAQWATLVQWVNNGDIKPDEFSLYRRVHEMGPLGLKAQVAGAFLNDDERIEVKDYLTKTALGNTFNIQFATRTPREALVYNRVIGDLVRLDLQREEIKVRQHEQRLLEMQVQKLGKELNEGKVQEMQSEDLKLLQSAINQLSRSDSEPRYKTVFDLTKPN